MWPTPAASAGSRGSDPIRTNPKAGGLTLRQTVEQSGLHSPTTTTDGATTSPAADLNPRFVEALMNLPDGWSDPSASVTGYTSWETAWSLSPPHTPSAPSLLEPASET